MSSESTELSAVPEPTAPTAVAPTGKASGEAALLVAIQSAITRPATVKAARGLSHFGEHSLGWLALAGAGALLASRRGDETAKRRYIEAGVGAFGAHAASVIIKRVVRRPRPDHPDIKVGVGTPSKLSFPSSHATSTTAAAILLGRAAGLKPTTLPAVIVPPMLVSRLVLGVHYPTDVLAGAAIGAASAGAVIVGDKLLGDTALAQKLFAYRKPGV
ncbi:phosphatase PAP2 family protein [Gordonia sp. X0973]|uniref:phosphatase PAP2 family protein n=1 Tax=Gordonia sp. X0973 TaxID=2742602 RepID=UPI000F547784|nr:phosphatase PAP2 family protein [Gordonia sp. X0973]QKT05863.1 phosphatase PAP2 family protein [Gordonia sp. X0973]